MAFKIDATLLEDPDNPPIELIKYLIEQKQTELTRLDKLDNYYLGKHDILKRDFTSPGAKNNRVMVNHAKYISDMVTGMMTGNPISYVTQDGENIDAITEAFNRMDISAHDTELERDLSVFGVAYEINYLTVIGTNQTDERIALLDPRLTFVVTDDTEDENLLFGVYLQPKKTLSGSDNGFLISVYTAHKLIQYRTNNGPLPDTSNQMAGYPKVSPHYWGEEPITEYQNNRQMQGDFEQVISSIDEYNNLQSDRIADKDGFVDALLLVYGLSMDGQVKKGQMIDDLPPKTEGASIEWLTKTLDENDTQTLADSVTNDIHEMSFVPNLNDKDFAGNISGEAMKYKLLGLLNLISVKEQSLKRSLRRRLTLMQNMLKIKEQLVDITDVKINIVPNIPVNLTDTVTNIKTADGVIPREITYSWLPDDYDPKKLMELMKQQTADNISTQRQAMSGTDELESNSSTDTEQGGYRDDSNNDS